MFTTWSESMLFLLLILNHQSARRTITDDVWPQKYSNSFSSIHVYTIYTETLWFWFWQEHFLYTHKCLESFPTFIYSIHSEMPLFWFWHVRFTTHTAISSLQLILSCLRPRHKAANHHALRTRKSLSSSSRYLSCVHTDGQLSVHTYAWSY
jgi:hypothetical protein